jgi:hypothetical protein
MSLRHRFVLEGHDPRNGFVRRSFKSRKFALELAKKLLDTEVYDQKDKKYIYGTSSFYKRILIAEKSL